MAARLYTSTLVVTDAAEVDVIAGTQCSDIYVLEQNTASGWPRTYLVRGSANSLLTGTLVSSSQNPVTPGTLFRFTGTFFPGDKAGTVQLAAAGGDSTTFNKQESTS